MSRILASEVRSEPEPAAATDRSWQDAFDSAGRILEPAAVRYKWLLLVTFCIGYLVPTGYRASRKVLWYDEIFTVDLAGLPDVGSLWRALMQGVDFNSPLFYLLTSATTKLLGPGHLGARLPEIIGFGVFCLCLFRFVSMRSSVLGGAVAMLFPLVTNAYLYSYEARPHGIVAGCCGVALVCWQSAVGGGAGRRLWWLTGLGAALAVGVLNHAYAVLLFMPVIIGEAARSIVRRRIDLPVWLTLLVASTSCAMLVPAARLASAPGIAGDWGGRWYTSFDQALARVLDAYLWHFEGGAVALAVGIASFALAARTTPRQPSVARTAGHRMPGHELAALVGLLLLPVFATVLSLATTSSLFDRYSISCVGAAGALLALSLAARPVAALAVTATLVLQIAVLHLDYARTTVMVEPSSKMRISTDLPRFMKRYETFDRQADGNIPIALVDKLDFAAMLHYAPPELAARMTYVMPGESDGLGRLYKRLQACCAVPGSVANVKDFVAAHPRFLIYGLDRSAYRLQDFVDAGADVRMIETTRSSFLGLVTR